MMNNELLQSSAASTKELKLTSDFLLVPECFKLSEFEEGI
jgi:hypothetical protein